MVTAAGWDVGKISKSEDKRNPIDRQEPALKTTSLKITCRAVGPKGKPDGAPPMPPLRMHTNTPMQEKVDGENMSETDRKPARDSDNNE